MKKKEIKILIIIVVLAILCIAGLNVFLKSNTTTDSNAAPNEKAEGIWVAVIHNQKVEKWFDSGIDADYTVTGDYGEMTIEVKDGKWHVKEVECPNHTCEGMGWDDGNSIMPITCIPNGIMIASQELAENYLLNE